MKIKRLHVTNFKGARSIDIHAADPIVNELTGENGAGKSSTLDSIVAGIAGARGIDNIPISRGASSGDIEIDLGDVIAIRRFTEKNQSRGGTLTVKASDGSKWGQRQLDELLGEFTFDPLAFSKMRPCDQISALQKLAGDEFCRELQRLDSEIAHLAEQRPMIKRDIAMIGSIAAIEKTEPVDTSDLVEQLELWDKYGAARLEHLSAIEQCGSEVKRLEHACEDAAEALAEAKRILEREEDRERLLRKSLRAAIDEAKKAEEALAILPPPNVPPRDEIKNRLASADAANARANDYRHAEKMRITKRKYEMDLASVEREIKRVREARAQYAKSAELPIPGLSWGSDGVEIDGLPFGQLSSSQKLKLSVAIGMAVNARLKIMFIRDGSLLGETAFDEIIKLAKENDYQLWIETVDSNHEDAMVIEDGVLDTGGSL